MVTRQLQVERRTGKVRRPKTDVPPLCHETNYCTEESKTEITRGVTLPRQIGSVVIIRDIIIIIIIIIIFSIHGVVVVAVIRHVDDGCWRRVIQLLRGLRGNTEAELATAADCLLRELTNQRELGVAVLSNHLQ